MNVQVTSESHGFTLVELLTVIAIIAILTGLVLGIAGYASRKASIARAEADVAQIRDALEEYRTEYAAIPRPFRTIQRFCVVTSGTLLNRTGWRLFW